MFERVAAWHAPRLGTALRELSVAANHSKLWMAAAAILWTYGGRPGRRAALRGLSAVAVTSATVNLPGKMLAARGRPDIAVVPEGRRLVRLPTSPSFPSGHAASAAAFATGASLEMPRTVLPLALAGAAVGLSRVTTGVHYPGDVVAGAGIGMLLALATLRTWPLPERAPAFGRLQSTQRRPQPDGAGLAMVVNTRAGTTSTAAAVDALRLELPRARIVTVDDPAALVRALWDASAEADALGIAGGDGSVSTAAEVAHAAGLPLLVVPTGSLNHLAADIGVTTVDEAVAALRGGLLMDSDVGEVDGRVFVNAAVLGTYPGLVDARERLEPRTGKWAAFAFALAAAVSAAEPVEVEFDGRVCRVWQLFVGNCAHPGPGLSPTHRRRFDDGAFDVRILHAVPWARLRFAVNLVLGTLARTPVYEQRVVDGLMIRSRGGRVRLAADGETFWGSPVFAVQKRPRPLRVFVPPPG